MPLETLAGPAQYQQVGRITVVREDLNPGGSKARFLPYLMEGPEEIVFGSPFCGGAQFALATLGAQTGQRITLFSAQRKTLHRRQLQALRLGAVIHQVPYGYMSNVQAKARAYAARVGARFLPLGFDLPAAEEPFVAFMEGIRRERGSPDQVWCATGSGMLARCLGRAFPDSEICAVAVGLASRHDAQHFGPNVTLRPTHYAFDQECRDEPPFPSDPHYERKAWLQCSQASRGSVLFWNVLG